MEYSKKTWGTYTIDDSKSRAENVAAADKKNALIKKADLDRWETAHETAAKEINGLAPVNNLTGTDATKPLAAPQGKALNDKITTLESSITGSWVQSINAPNGTTKSVKLAVDLTTASNGHKISFFFFGPAGTFDISVNASISGGTRKAMTTSHIINGSTTVENTDTGATITLASTWGETYYIVGNRRGLKYSFEWE
jgi:hypothetical protein